MTTESQSIEIPNRLDAMSDMELWLAGLGQAWELSPQLAFALDLVVNEAVTNIIQYAYADDAEHSISVSISNRPEGLLVAINDDGTPFNPLDHPEMVFATDLQSATIGGRGIHLIRTHSARQHYRRESGRNILELVLV